MRKKPDENGLYDCPDCGAEVSEFESFCSECGKSLPFPANIQDLAAKEYLEAVLGCDHERIMCLAKFCPNCGEKL